MKPIEDVYTDKYSYWGDYNPMLRSFGYQILLQVDDHDYQGDSRVLFKDDFGRYGVLIFGWGSCSGCDALQACTSLAEVDNLRGSLHNSIHWEDSAKDMHDWITNRDWEVQFSWHCDETKRFISEAIALLEQR